MFRDSRICLYQKFKDNLSLRNMMFDISRAILLRDNHLKFTLGALILYFEVAVLVRNPGMTQLIVIESFPVK